MHQSEGQEKMGILHSISRFLGSKSQGEEETDQISLHLHHASSADSSTISERLPTKISILHSLICKIVKGLVQKLRFVFFLLRPRKPSADPILPVQNPTPVITTTGNDSSTNSASGTPLADLNADDQESQFCEEVYDVSSRQWPPKTSSKIMIQNVVPAVKESKKIVEKEKEKKREQKDEAIIVKRSTVVAALVDEERWIKHYSSRHRILVVGDGDFSFSASLGVAFGRASNMISTSLNSIDFLKKNYGNAPSNIEKLRSRGCKVMHGIDATEIANHALLGHLKFDRIVYNFPFAGFFPNLPQGSQLRRHRTLVSLFLKNAKEMISENGEIHISHKTNGFHAEWKLQSIASSHGLRLIEAVDFNLLDYPGYNTKYGFGGDGNFNCYPSNTFKFGLKY